MKKGTKSENLIHIRLEYDEALESKMKTLSSQMDMLEIIKSIKKYRALRVEELKLKAKLHRTLKELNTSLRKLQKNLPTIEVPKIFEKEKEIKKEIEKIRKTKTEIRIEKAKENQYDKSIESQLKQIQKQLDKLSNI